VQGGFTQSVFPSFDEILDHREPFETPHSPLSKPISSHATLKLLFPKPYLSLSINTLTARISKGKCLLVIPTAVVEMHEADDVTL
jgi:hypothetical protein